MEKRMPIIAAFFLLLASAAILTNRSPQNLQVFSPQATVDPTTISDTSNPAANAAIYDNEGIVVPNTVDQFIATRPVVSDVLGATADEKRIEIDLTNQRLYAFEGNQKVFDFLVSTGKWGRTPTGVFKVWIKLTATTMQGGSQELGTYYYLPNVPYTMFFYNDQIPQWRGYGIHGTYWHENFGTPMSHGCINMRTSEVEQLFYWATPELYGNWSAYASPQNPGTTIIIYGTAPSS